MKVRLLGTYTAIFESMIAMRAQGVPFISPECGMLSKALIIYHKPFVEYDVYLYSQSSISSRLRIRRRDYELAKLICTASLDEDE